MEDTKIKYFKEDNSNSLDEKIDFKESTSQNEFAPNDSVAQEDEKVQTGISTTRKISRKLLRTPKCARF